MDEKHLMADDLPPEDTFVFCPFCFKDAPTMTILADETRFLYKCESCGMDFYMFDKTILGYFIPSNLIDIVGASITGRLKNKSNLYSNATEFILNGQMIKTMEFHPIPFPPKKQDFQYLIDRFHKLLSYL